MAIFSGEYCFSKASINIGKETFDVIQKSFQKLSKNFFHEASTPGIQNFHPNWQRVNLSPKANSQFYATKVFLKIWFYNENWSPDEYVSIHQLTTVYGHKIFFLQNWDISGEWWVFYILRKVSLIVLSKTHIHRLPSGSKMNTCTFQLSKLEW